MRRTEIQRETVSLPKICVKSLILSFILCWCLLVLGAALITYVGLPKELAWLVTLVSVGAASVFGGYFISARVGSKGLVFGTLFGVLLFFAMYIIGVFCFDSEAVLSNALLRFVVMTFAGALGGIAGVNRKQKRRR